MRLGHKLLVLMLVVTLIPLSMSGLTAYVRTRHALSEGVERSQSRTAEDLARLVGKSLEGTLDPLIFTLSVVRFERLTPAERLGALRLLYRQTPGATIVALFDSHGTSIGPAVSLPRGDAAHEGVAEGDLDRFEQSVPLAAALSTPPGPPAGRVAVSAPYRTASGAPRVSAAIAFPAGSDTWVLSAELSLRAIEALLDPSGLGPEAGSALLDAAGRPFLVGPHGPPAPDRIFLAHAPLPAPFQAVSGGRPVLGAVAEVPGFPWRLAVYQAEREAFRLVNLIVNQNLAWLGLALLAALAVSGLFARRLSGPVRDLAAASLSFARGDLTQRVPMARRDEIGDLARSFNRMGEDLARSRSEIERQNEELRRWNVELESRVDEKTRALREAQNQLIESRKMAAVGELGAGVAHELNNPLVGILGFTQILLSRKAAEDPDARPLRIIEEQAQRCRTIVEGLLRLTQAPMGEGYVRTDLSRLVRALLSVEEATLRSAGIRVEVDLADPLPPLLGDPAALQELLQQILSNARNAMPLGGTLTLKTWAEGADLVRARVRDTGRGIPADHLPRIFDPFFTTKDAWEGKGLGLTLARKIVEDHHGSIEIQSTPGRGTDVTLTFPALTHTQLA